jgi:uncharacterized protein YraI
MMSRATWPSGSVLRVVVVLSALAFSVIQTPPAADAQSCTTCVVAAGVPLNLLQEPKLEAKVLRTIPQGSLLMRGAGPETNRFVPVAYGGMSGWVIADGVFPAPEAERYTTTSGPTAAPPPSATTTTTDARVTLAPLMLRGAPSMEAEPITVMPLGEMVTLTWEGAENGYVTVDYGGVHGWAYADLLGEPVGAGPSTTRGVTAVTNGGVAPVAAEPPPVSEVTIAEEPVSVDAVAAEPVYEAPVVDDEPVTEPPAPVAGECDPSYPDQCIPPGSADLDCDYVYGLGLSSITVYPPDPHGFDGNGDSVGCEG